MPVESMPVESLRVQAVQLPIIPVVAELIRNSPGTISLGQGVVSYGPPPEAIAQLQDFLSQPQNHKYQEVRGIPLLKQAIQAKLMADNGVAIDDRREIVVTAGSNMGFLNAVLAIADPGDEIILQSPYYFNHEMAIQLADCRAVIVPTDANFQLDLVAIRQAITERTRAIVTISPNNPTGAVYPEADLRAVNELCREASLYHIADETYEYFTYDGAKHFSVSAIADSHPYTISLYSLSKAYGFASWRIGYMVIPAHLTTAVQKIQDTNLICAPVISQYAAYGALQAGWKFCQEKVSAIAQVRQTVLRVIEGVPDLCSTPPAQGAFYFLLKIPTPLDSLELVKRLVQDHQVAALPGSTFGLTQGCYLRVAYGALDNATAAEAVGRLVQGLKAIL
ncbi:MAG: pyridoxal phosphate-dependent aminotransferase [Oculatellaceae cyanobacterium Prado106]|jgi:aspartate/methionine/tyrosine aminotransferase|nr:pyridoxal phosphate-dependent aminotransferase [Oculatellaceae cyanobacterium Prado106]